MFDDIVIYRSGDIKATLSDRHMYHQRVDISDGFFLVSMVVVIDNETPDSLSDLVKHHVFHIRQLRARQRPIKTHIPVIAVQEVYYHE